MSALLSQAGRWIVAVAAAGVLAGCAGTSRAPAPVEDRNPAARPIAAVVAPEAARPLPGAENAGKPGFYTVKPGDTLIRIALENGQNWRDLVRWNAIDNPNVIEVGQVLRVIAPSGPPQTDIAVTRPVAPGSVVASAPLPAASAAGAPRAAASGASAPAPAVAAAPAAATSEDEVAWAWPIAGTPTVLAGFDEVKNKGLDISGKAGDAVLASADGRVVYSGAGLRGYGNLIILKHNNTYLTAYAHNQTLLVKEDQSVRKGQKIAEMGSSDTDRVKLHFEIRRQGKPVDPVKFLPAR